MNYKAPASDIGKNRPRYGHTIDITRMLTVLMYCVFKSLCFEVEYFEHLLMRVIDNDILCSYYGIVDLPQRLQLVGVNECLISDIPLG